MQTVEVKVVDWQTTIVRILGVSLIQPVTVTVIELATHKYVPFASFRFAALFLFYVVLQIVPLLLFFLRGSVSSIIADDAGLKISAFRNSRRISWSQIDTMERAQVMSSRALKDVVILRDAGGLVLLEFNDGGHGLVLSRTQFRQLEDAMVQRIGKKSIVSSGPFEPTPAKSTFALTTRYKILGVGTLFLWLPCAYLSWNAPTGGPVVGSLFLGFALLGIVLAFQDKRYEVDERGVRVFWFSRRNELRWQEIRHIGVIEETGTLWVLGEHKQLDLLSPALWKEGGMLTQFFQEQARRYGIVWEPQATPKWRRDILIQKSQAASPPL